MKIISLIAALAGGPLARVVCVARRQHDDLLVGDGSKVCRRCLATTPSRLVT